MTLNELLFFLIHAEVLSNRSDLHDDVDVVICNHVNVLFGKDYRVGKELFGDGRVEVFDIKCGEGVLIFVLYVSRTS